jgi:hypothetical protein
MTTTIYVSASAIGVSAKNKNFPRLTEIPALRLMHQHDFNRRGLRVNPNGGFVSKRVPIVGRCPTVQQ